MKKILQPHASEAHYNIYIGSYDLSRRSVPMLEPLFGSINRENVLLYLNFRKEGYAREISRYFKTDLTPIQKQLQRLENGGVLYSRNAGRTRLYGMNPRYPFLAELRSLLDRALAFYPPEEKERLTMARTRPRRKGKPL